MNLLIRQHRSVKQVGGLASNIIENARTSGDRKAQASVKIADVVNLTLSEYYLPNRNRNAITMES